MFGEDKIKILVIIQGIILFLVVANLAFLDLNFFGKPQNTEPNVSALPSPSITPTLKPTISLEISSPTPTTKPAAKAPSVVSNDSSVKEYFIPFGSGTSEATDWTDVAGARATADLGAYKNVKSMVFEASVSVPTGNQSVSVRVYNVSDNHPVWYSEVTMDGGSSAYLISSPIIYDSGSKIYQVQIKNQLGFTANLTQARIHISLK